jgi:O-antigen/teichoic acid export membrane protein
VALLLLASASIAIFLLPSLGAIVFLGNRGLFGLQSLSSLAVAATVALIAIAAFQQLGRYWAIRQNHLSLIERATYSRAGLLLILRLGVIAAIIAKQAHGRSLGAALLLVEIASYLPAIWTLLPRTTLAELRDAWNLGLFGETLRRNWVFPVLEMPSTAIGSAILSGPIFLVTQFFGLTATASFGLAYRAMAVPIGQLALAVADVVQARHSKWLLLGQFNAMKRMFYRSSALFAVVGFFGCLATYLLSRMLPLIPLGAKLGAAAQLVVALSPWIALSVVVNANSRLIPLLKRIDLKLIYDALSGLFLLVAWLAQSAMHFALAGFVAIMAAGQSLAYVAYWLIIRYALVSASKRSKTATIGSGEVLFEPVGEPLK